MQMFLLYFRTWYYRYRAVPFNLRSGFRDPYSDHSLDGQVIDYVTIFTQLFCALADQKRLPAETLRRLGTLLKGLKMIAHVSPFVSKILG